MSPGRPPTPGCMLSPPTPAHHQVPVPKTGSPGEPVAASATSGSSGEWPRRHRAARTRRTCAKSHAGETEARGETELWTELPDPPPALSLPTLHGDRWQFRCHQPSPGTRAGDTPRWAHTWLGGPGGPLPCSISRQAGAPLGAGGCTPGCWRCPGAGWALAAGRAWDPPRDLAPPVSSPGCDVRSNPLPSQPRSGFRGSGQPRQAP